MINRIPPAVTNKNTPVCSNRNTPVITSRNTPPDKGKGRSFNENNIKGVPEDGEKTDVS